MIIFSDFDGTLYLPNDAAAFSRNLEAVKRFRAAGQQFALATGRGLTNLKKALPDAEERFDYFVLSDGAVVLDRAGKVIFSENFRPEMLDNLSEMIRAADPEAAVIYYDETGAEYPTTPEMTCKVRIWSKVPERVEKMMKGIRATYGDELRAFWYPNIEHNHDADLTWVDAAADQVIDMTLGGASKERGVGIVLEKMGLTQERVFTIGDEMNDMKMLVAYNGYAVANAKPEVLENVPTDHVVPTVADLVEKLL